MSDGNEGPPLEVRTLFEQFVADLRSRGTKPRLRVMVKMEESRAKIVQSLSRYGNRRQWRDLYPTRPALASSIA
jgi:hypothetical protein